MNRNRLLVILLLSFLVLPVRVIGSEVYKWVDEQGRTHYSNQKPSAVDKVETIEVFDSASTPSKAPDSAAELTRIKELTRQLAEEREARERQRLEDRVNDLEEAYQQLLNEKTYTQENEDNAIGLYAIPPYYHPPIKPHPPWWKIHRDSHKTKPIEHRPPFKRLPPERPPVTRITPREQGAPTRQRTILPTGIANQKAPPATFIAPSSAPKP